MGLMSLRVFPHFFFLKWAMYEFCWFLLECCGGEKLGNMKKLAILQQYPSNFGKNRDVGCLDPELCRNKRIWQHLFYLCLGRSHSYWMEVNWVMMGFWGGLRGLDSLDVLNSLEKKTWDRLFMLSCSYKYFLFSIRRAGIRFRHLLFKFLYGRILY